MVATLNDIRALGFRRIWKIVTESEGQFVTTKDLNSFERALDDVSKLLLVSRIVPYSVLDHWGSLSKLSGDVAGGLSNLMLDASPMIADIEYPSKAEKRKFRNTWDTLWVRFCDACGLSVLMRERISALGLALPAVIAGIRYNDKSLVKFTDCEIPYDQKFIIDLLNFDSEVEGTTIDKAFKPQHPIGLLCLFYNMVIGWYLSVCNETSMDSMVQFLAVMDFDEFKMSFAKGDKLWVFWDRLRLGDGDYISTEDDAWHGNENSKDSSLLDIAPVDSLEDF